MDLISNVLLNGGIGLASFLALCFLGKYILNDMKDSIDKNTNVLSEVKDVMISVKEVIKLKKGDE